MHAFVRPGLTPTPCCPVGEAPLTEAQVQSWREGGFAVVEGLFPPEAWAAAQAAIDELMPKSLVGEFEAAKRMEKHSADAQMKRGMHPSSVQFPCGTAALDALVLHERLLGAAGQLLGTAATDLRLLQADFWPKVGGPPLADGDRHPKRFNADQRIHMDYMNHTLVHPQPFDRPGSVAAIVYFDDYEEVGGCTAAVPREGDADPAYTWPYEAMPGFGALDWINDRLSAEDDLQEKAPAVAKFREQLYSRERPVLFKPGTVLLYRLDVWHRGTPLREGKLRRVANLELRRGSADWLQAWQPGWPRANYSEGRTLERIVAKGSVAQRAVLGFPPPGDAYWSEATLAAVEARYRDLGFDVTPYVQAFRAGRLTRWLLRGFVVVGLTAGLVASSRRLHRSL